MADTEARGISPPQRQDVTIPGLGFGPAPGVSARPSPVALPGVPTPDTSASQSLIRSLGISSNTLDAVDQAYLKEQREEQFKQGQMAKQDSQKNFADAQAQGVIPQGANPWFIKGYQNQDGRVLALARNAAMQEAYANSPAKGNDDPAVFQKFMEDFNKGYAAKLPADRSTDWWDGFSKVSGEGDEAMGRYHAADVAQAVSAKQATNTGAEVNVILNSTKDPQAAGAAIEQLREKMRLDGMAPQDFDKVASEQILANAKSGNGAMLQVLDHVKTDAKSGATLASDAKVSMARVGVQQFLTDQSRSAQQFAWAAQREAYWENVTRPFAEKQMQHTMTEWAEHAAVMDRDQQSRSLMTQIQTTTMAHPGTAVEESRALFNKLSEVDPLKVDTMRNFQQAYLNNSNNVSPVAEAPVASEFRDRLIRAAGDPEAENQLMLDMSEAVTKKRLNVTTYNTLFVDAQRMSQADPSYNHKLNSPEMNSLKESAKGLFTEITVNGQAVMFGQKSADYLAAVDVINRAAQDFLKKNPNATAQDVREASEKALNAFLPSVTRNAAAGGTMGILGQEATNASKLPAYPAAPAPAPLPKGQVAPPPTEMETHLQKLAEADKMALLREAAQAHRKGPQAFAQFLMQQDQALGVPGITAAIITEANTRATATPPNR